MSGLPPEADTNRKGRHVRWVADSVAKVPKAAAAKFSPKNETSDNRRSIEPQTRCQNRLCVWGVATWSPTSLFNRRAHASENLRAMPQKDFCNTICQKRTLLAARRPVIAFGRG